MKKALTVIILLAISMTANGGESIENKRVMVCWIPSKDKKITIYMENQTIVTTARYSISHYLELNETIKDVVLENKTLTVKKINFGLDGNNEIYIKDVFLDAGASGKIFIRTVNPETMESQIKSSIRALNISSNTPATCSTQIIGAPKPGVSGGN